MTTIEVNTYKFSVTPKSDNTFRMETFRIADRMGVGSWVVLNQDGSVARSDRNALPADDVMAEMRQALNTYLTGEVPGATYRLDEILRGVPAVSLSDLSDKDMIKAVYERTQTPIVHGMGSYIVRVIRDQAKRPAQYRVNYDDLTNLNELVQEAYEETVNRE